MNSGLSVAWCFLPLLGAAWLINFGRFVMNPSLAAALYLLALLGAAWIIFSGHK